MTDKIKTARLPEDFIVPFSWDSGEKDRRLAQHGGELHLNCDKALMRVQKIQERRQAFGDLTGQTFFTLLDNN